MSLLSVPDHQLDRDKTMDVGRRSFIKKVGLAGATAAVAATSSAVSSPYVWAQGKTHNWRMVTTWPPDFPVLQTGAERYAKRVEQMSEGRIKIQVYAAGELVPALETFDAVSQGKVEVGSSAAYYWADKLPAAQWFSAVPFGFNPIGINSWFYTGDGLERWEEIYAPFNLVPRPQMNTGIQMGGWFNRKIESIDDFKGLKMRIPGLGGKVIAKAGATVVLLPAGEIYKALASGAIDATEWIGPLHDLRMGFYKAAKYYYYPGWHEPGTCLEVIFNKKVYDSLPSDLKAVLDAAAFESNMRSLCEFETRNGEALITLVTKHQVQLLQFPYSVLGDLKKISDEVLEDEASKDKSTRKVYESFKAHREKLRKWREVSDSSFLILSVLGARSSGSALTGG